MKILILSASVGAGHLRAAEAVELALKELAPHARIKNQDVLQLTNKTFRRIYGQAYLDLVNKAPHVLGYFYEILDQPRGPKGKSDRLRLLVERLNLGKVIQGLQAEPWDLIVNTHFLPAEIIAYLKRKEKIRIPQMTVTTDFEIHRLWIADPCEHYCTATAEGAVCLSQWGVPAENISVTGIPIHPSFGIVPDRTACLKNFGLTGDRPVILQLAGGFGVGPIDKIFDALLCIERPLQLIVITGRNEQARKILETKQKQSKHRITIMGFTDKMAELMTAADLIVSKPGGLTTSEVLASGAVMVIVNPIPGQESRNSDFLLENGAAMKVNHINLLSYKITRLLEDKTRLRALKKQSRKLGKPGAANHISRLALRIAAEHR